MQLEVLDSRIEKDVQVVTVRPTVNQKAQTIEQAIAKMQHAQVQLVDLLVDDLKVSARPSRCSHPLPMARAYLRLLRRVARLLHCCLKRVGAPPTTLRPLTVLRTSHNLRESSWFNEGSNIQKATNDAITARREALRLLQQAATWTASSADALKMCLAAELFAVEGEHDAAIRLLLLSLKQYPHPRLGETEYDRVATIFAAAGGEPPSPAPNGAPSISSVDWKGRNARDVAAHGGDVHHVGGHELVGGYECLLVLQMLLSMSKGAAPWHGTIVRVAASAADASVLDGLVQLLVLHGACRGLEQHRSPRCRSVTLAAITGAHCR